jgi:flavin-dependent dehydrogenase
MKVCIIGAGLSGLSCALTLEKHGIVPDIYEQFERPGGMVPFVICLLQIMNRPIPDPLISLKKDYGISLTPISVLDKIVRFSEKKMSKSTGKLGYIFESGPSKRSIQHDLYKELRFAKVQFNTVADYKNLSSSYDKVIVAAGTPYAAKELGCWSKDIFRSWVRGAAIEGNFDTSAWIVWYNKLYANNGFAYLAPFDSNTATLVLIVSDVKEEEVESKWNMFLDREKITNSLKQHFLKEHIAGLCNRREIGNVLLVGNSGGLMESILGFGIFNAIASGVLAAKAIVNNLSYDSLVSRFDDKLHKSYLIRKRLNNLTNKGYDKILGISKVAPIDKLIYNTNLDVLSLHEKLSRF